MDESVQLAALALVELVARQIVSPDQVQLHRDELEVVMGGTDPTFVALEVALLLIAAAGASSFPLAELIEVKRARLLAT